MADPIRVVQYGVGPIGQECIRAVLAKEATGLVKLVGAIDVDPTKQGRDLSELIDRDELTGVRVHEDAERVLAESSPHVVLHATSSFLEDVHRQIVPCLLRGLHVISSTEELAYPFERHPELSRKLDGMARSRGVVLVGTGVNPGFVMDTLALLATGACTEISGVRVERTVDAGKRRLPLLVKIGAGLSPEEFSARSQSGRFGHIGLRESLLLVAAGLGWTLDRIEESLEPVIASREVYTRHLTVKVGSVAGLHHVISGFVNGRAVVVLDLKMYAGAEEPQDVVRIAGSPPIDLVVREGIFGDTATVATLVNMIPIVMTAEPGLRTMVDLPVLRAFATVPTEMIHHI